ncbi:hypothetical protein DR88_5160 [Klebsiella pneumoniae]|nr:hypothetical protein DR88_5160 [Klebsiella pneumoniae]
MVTIQVEGFRGERPGFTDTAPGIPHGGEQHVVTLVRHIPEEGAHFRRQEVSRRGTC